MTWDELLEHMDNLVEWGQGEIKGWHSQAAKFIQVKGTVATTETACVAMDLKSRVSFQNKLAGICEDMCKEVGAYPQCAQCPGFVAPDSTPGVMTWDELLEHMDNLVEWGQGEIKGWHSQAAKFLQKGSVAVSLYSLEAFAATVKASKAKNPSFSEETCGAMYGTKTKLGGSIPPSDFVVGCEEVCASVKALKGYWGTGEMATFACGQGAAYGCVYDGTPPVQMSGIGC